MSESEQKKEDGSQPPVSNGSADNQIPRDEVKELLEKNLKWSQIIYEQNRRINNKLLWSAICDWLKLLIIAVPIILAIIYLPPAVKNFWHKMQTQLGITSSSTASANSVDNLLYFLNLNSTQKEQLKSLLR